MAETDDLNHGAAVADVQACLSNIQNFLGSASHPDLQTALTYAASAQQNPASAASMLAQIQAIQSNIFATDPLKGVAAKMQTELQGKEISVFEPVSQQDVTKPLPVTNVKANIGDMEGAQSLAVVLTIPHGDEQNYKQIITAAEAVLAEKFPALAELQPSGKGSWHGDEQYKLEYKIPSEIDPGKLTAALLQGKSLKETQEAATSASQPEAAAATATAQVAASTPDTAGSAVENPAGLAVVPKGGFAANITPKEPIQPREPVQPGATKPETIEEQKREAGGPPGIAA